MNTTRRVFIKQGALALASVGIAPAFGPGFLRNTVFDDEPRRAGQGAGGGRRCPLAILIIKDIAVWTITALPSRAPGHRALLISMAPLACTRL